MQEGGNFETVAGSFNTFFLITDFIKFWFWQGPIGLVKFFSSMNAACLKVLSFRILVSTFFKPWKNEYREGLVEFSVAMGMFIKSIIIVFDALFFLLLVFVEAIFIIAFIVWPFATLALAFI